MAIEKKYGKLVLSGKEWHVSQLEPHICIKMKGLFPRIDKYKIQPFILPNLPDICNDIFWFMFRYPLEISQKDRTILKSNAAIHIETVNKSEAILLPTYIPKVVKLKDGLKARDYQEKGGEYLFLNKRYLLGDDLGLGKSLTAILPMFNKKTLPALIVVQSHLANQWKNDQVEKFTNLRVHIINGRKPYSLPKSDVYIIRYSCVGYWLHIYEKRFFKYAVFDEVQELRHNTTDKYKGAKVLSEHVDYCIGLSATPIYNYGDEIYNVVDALKPEAMGKREDFMREWTGGGKTVKEPQALGTYLRDSQLLLRRTRSDVGRELPKVNKLVYTVDYDEKIIENEAMLMQQLAQTVLHSTSFVERGQAARELDIRMRHDTGLSKAKFVAQFVKMLLDEKESVLLAGWHRDVYDVWMEELKKYNPCLFTGSESGKQKDETKMKFINGETDLMIMSLRSGAGIDGLQKRCRTVVYGELDWSPKVHDQFTGRVDRDGNKNQVTAIYLVSEYGSDPLIINMLGIKGSQSHGIMDPLTDIPEKYSDESRIKLLAESIIKKSA